MKIYDTFEKMFELIESEFLCWDTQDLQKKKYILEIIGSNLFVNEKNRLQIDFPDFLQTDFMGFSEVVGSEGFEPPTLWV